MQHINHSAHILKMVDQAPGVKKTITCGQCADFIKFMGSTVAIGSCASFEAGKHGADPVQILKAKKARDMHRKALYADYERNCRVFKELS